MQFFSKITEGQHVLLQALCFHDLFRQVGTELPFFRKHQYGCSRLWNFAQSQETYPYTSKLARRARRAARARGTAPAGFEV